MRGDPMRYQTELMRSILTCPTSKKIVDYVSPIYGNSYVALNIFQAIGLVMEELVVICDSLREETNPATATFLLELWEAQYGITTDYSLTIDQRRKRVMAKIQSRGPCNPTVLARAVSAALGGAEVEITENVAKNTFLVSIIEYVEDITPAVAVLERMKPAHLIYQIRVATNMVADKDIKVAIAITHAERYKVEVHK